MKVLDAIEAIGAPGPPAAGRPACVPAYPASPVTRRSSVTPSEKKNTPTAALI